MAASDPTVMEAFYLERCESSLKSASTARDTDSKPIKTLYFTSPQIVDSHSIPDLEEDSNDFAVNIDATTSKTSQWKQCGQTFNRDCDLYGHIRNKHNLPPFACDVAGCGATFRWNRDLRQHQRSHKATHRNGANTMKLWECAECNIQYELLSSLKRHKREKHGFDAGSDINYRATKRRKISMISVPQSGAQPRHQCNICFKVFSSGSALGGHKSAAHRNGKGVTNLAEYRCDRCFRSFTTIHGLNGHRRHCTVFPCDHCEYRATRKDNLYGHLRDKHDIAPFVCNIDDCSSAFRYYRELQKHQKLYHGSFGAWKLGDSSSNNGNIMYPLFMLHGQRLKRREKLKADRTRWIWI